MRDKFLSFLWGKKQIKRLLTEKQIHQVSKAPRMEFGEVILMGEKFTFTDNISFIDAYNEIFINEIYKFRTDENSQEKLIIDCGANIGLSALYFSEKYPNHEIICFEPDPIIFEILEQNLSTRKNNGIVLKNKAIWISEDDLTFFRDGAMAGSFFESLNRSKIKVQSEKLSKYLNRKVDLLKIDIEGAEVEVLKANELLLENVNNIFVEYHSYIGREQQLDIILKVLTKSGFRYQIKEAYASKNPFWENLAICGNMEMALNIFATKR